MNNQECSRVLVVAPHPDDDLIGCGGSIAKHLKNSNQVFVVYITNGDAECPQFLPAQFTKIRKKETFNAARIIGLKKENLFFLEEKPWQLNEERVRFKLLELIRRIQPNVCYIPHTADAHVDHRIVGQATLDAIIMAPSKWFRKYRSSEEVSLSSSLVLAYEVWTPLVFPNYIEDITEFMEIKIKALQEHKTQAIDKYVSAYQGMNAFRGAITGGKKDSFAEAFQILKTSNLFSWKK
jgi:LmbE family N-acetylglucosaminyl deacetylase